MWHSKPQKRGGRENVTREVNHTCTAPHLRLRRATGEVQVNAVRCMCAKNQRDIEIEMGTATG